MTFENNVKPIAVTDEVLYMLQEGYIKPQEILEEPDATKLQEAVELLTQFIEEGESKGILEMYM